MLKMLSTATRWCMKKITAAVVFCAEKCASIASRLWTNVSQALTKGWNWLGTTMRKPAVTSITTPPTNITTKPMSTFGLVLKATRDMAWRRFLFFLCGLVCVFILPEETRGDLTWFESMLTSVNTTVTELGKKAYARVYDRIFGLFSSREAVT